MRALPLLLAAGLLALAAPPASAGHTCDLMPVVDPVELAGCLARCAADHALAGELPDCSFVHAAPGAPPGSDHLAPCPFGDVACFAGCVRDHARDLRNLDCAMELPL